MHATLTAQLPSLSQYLADRAVHVGNLGVEHGLSQGGSGPDSGSSASGGSSREHGAADEVQQNTTAEAELSSSITDFADVGSALSYINVRAWSRDADRQKKGGSMQVTHHSSKVSVTPMDTSDNNSSSNSSSTNTATITANDFLTLLVSEMKNQDPTTQQDPNEYINQLVQVNSLQQLIQINQNTDPPSSGSSSGSGSGSGSGSNDVSSRSVTSGNLSATSPTTSENSAPAARIASALAPSATRHTSNDALPATQAQPGADSNWNALIRKKLLN
jgi:flagellar basal-body rod modification protein FlgD